MPENAPLYPIEDDVMILTLALAEALIAGGIALRNARGALIGAIGVSGASKDQDRQIAAFAIAAVTAPRA
ncbi:heme-binding protein [Raoultella terrigena]|uniref:heme-binding protein n=2 Tax=Raoultella terrigena TaxID=577 RepID=UPI00132FB8FB|nr:heme-binding protein [Raoultella terrigena]